MCLFCLCQVYHDHSQSSISNSPYSALIKSSYIMSLCNMNIHANLVHVKFSLILGHLSLTEKLDCLRIMLDSFLHPSDSSFVQKAVPCLLRARTTFASNYNACFDSNNIIGHVQVQKKKRLCQIQLGKCDKNGVTTSRHAFYQATHHAVQVNMCFNLISLFFTQEVCF